jgi:hypothetical protein
VYTSETPLGGINYSDIFDLVVKHDLRPDQDDAPQMPDKMWKIAVDCWAKDPLARPSAVKLGASLGDLQKHNTTQGSEVALFIPPTSLPNQHSYR